MSPLFVARFEPLDKRTGFREDRASMIEDGRPLSFGHTCDEAIS